MCVCVEGVLLVLPVQLPQFNEYIVCLVCVCVEGVLLVLPVQLPQFNEYIVCLHTL